jgi:D-alanyl-D-alanine carboxypeptidase
VPRSWLFVLGFALSLAVTQPASAARMSSLVVDADSGEILTADNPDLQNYPASLTKMMTLYLTFEALRSGQLRLDSRLPVSAHAASQAPSKLSLAPGGTIVLDDAIRGIAVKSANDAAVVVGEALGGSEARFAQMMTAKAHALGMTNTQFRNASGLPNRGQVTTARDIALLALALRRDFPKQYHYFSNVEFTYHGQTHINHNHMLGKVNGVDGLKTGFIRASGFNIATSAERSGRRLVGVVLGGTSPSLRDQHMADLLDEGFVLASKRPPGGRVKLASGPALVLPVDGPVGQGATAALKKAVEKSTVRAKLPAVDDDLARATEATSVVAARGWAVQVGAFSRPNSAKLAAAKAQKRDVALKGKPIAVARAEGDDDDLYRARVVGLTQASASQACQRLRKQKITCFVIPPADSAAAVIRD